MGDFTNIIDAMISDLNAIGKNLESSISFCQRILDDVNKVKGDENGSKQA